MAEADARFGTGLARGHGADEKSLVMVPLVAGDVVRGADHAGGPCEREHAFSDSDVRLLADPGQRG